MDQSLCALLGPFCIQPNSVQDSMAAGVTLMRAKAPPVTPHKLLEAFPETATFITTKFVTTYAQIKIHGGTDCSLIGSV